MLLLKGYEELIGNSGIFPSIGAESFASQLKLSSSKFCISAGTFLDLVMAELYIILKLFLSCSSSSKSLPPSIPGSLGIRLIDERLEFLGVEFYFSTLS